MRETSLLEIPVSAPRPCGWRCRAGRPPSPPRTGTDPPDGTEFRYRRDRLERFRRAEPVEVHLLPAWAPQPATAANRADHRPTAPGISGGSGLKVGNFDPNPDVGTGSQKVGVQSRAAVGWLTSLRKVE